jgi:pimeloyl-ACP methyl ester carboxylesterase
VLVDVTPGVDESKAAAITAFVRGPEYFASFDEILARTVAFNPTRSLQSLRRGVIHNAEELRDGRWRWRYDRVVPSEGGIDYRRLWDDLSTLRMPVMLVVGGESKVVDDDDVAELCRRLPEAWVETVAGAGHSIQRDRPLQLARLLEDFAFGGAGSTGGGWSS